MFGFLKRPAKQLPRQPDPIQKAAAPTISYSIVTYPRPERYLSQTIKSLEATGFFDIPENLPLRLVGGSPDSSHLRTYVSDKRFLVDPMSEEEAREVHWHASGGGLRAIKGHRRALHPFKVNPGSEFLLVMEDDIHFTKGWIPRLDRTLKELVAQYQDRFVLSLYAPGVSSGIDTVLAAYHSGRLFVERNYDTFFGVQAVLYPVVIREAFMFETSVRAIDQERSPGKFMDRPYGTPHDLLVPKILKQMRIPLFSTAPSLVQHIGLKTGADSPPHESSSFVEQI